MNSHYVQLRDMDVNQIELTPIVTNFKPPEVTIQNNRFKCTNLFTIASKCIYKFNHKHGFCLGLFSIIALIVLMTCCNDIIVSGCVLFKAICICLIFGIIGLGVYYYKYIRPSYRLIP